MLQTLRFITWPTIAGILAALLILDHMQAPDTGPVTNETTTTTSYAQAVADASPSVVNIYTAKLVLDRRVPRFGDILANGIPLQPTKKQRVERSLGSGVILTEEGHILTNNHVIEGATTIQVLLHDGRTAQARVIGTDEATDLAVLAVRLTGLKPISLGDSDSVRVGDVVLAIGNPLGFGHSVTQGIVSALGRYGLQPNTYEDYIQTDAVIHLGNSGGALIDASGRLLGINSLIYTADGQSQGTPTGIGISLAIPANLAVFVMRDLIEYGEVIRGWLGVSVDPVRTATATGSIGEALVVSAVSDNSPAQKAGILVGDIITHLDNEPVKHGRQAMHQIAMLRPGDSVSVALQREQQSMEVRAVVGALNLSTVR